MILWRIWSKFGMPRILCRCFRISIYLVFINAGSLHPNPLINMIKLLELYPIGREITLIPDLQVTFSACFCYPDILLECSSYCHINISFLVIQKLEVCLDSLFGWCSCLVKIRCKFKQYSYKAIAYHIVCIQFVITWCNFGKIFLKSFQVVF